MTMDVRLRVSDGSLAEKRISSQCIMTVTIIISCFVSFFAFLVAIPLFLKIKPLLLNPFACTLTLCHHAMALHERMNITAATIWWPTSNLVIVSPSRKFPLPLALPMILVIWLTSVIWLVVSTINASLLGMSLWADPNGHYHYLIIGVVLPVMEVILLMFIVSWCLQERQAILRTDKGYLEL